MTVRRHHGNSHGSEYEKWTKPRRTPVGIGDKIGNKAQEALGKVKENTGDATDNASLQAEGAREEAEARAKQAGEHLKDATRDITDK